jgi:uroporphyrin-III C-methyltransferase / precorrin-2 dehydrogenase / sirohydrochlorin ferrochelatase
MNASRSPVETPPPRLTALARLPVFFVLAGKRAVLAGGTSAAAWKAELLSAAGAEVDVLAAELSDEMLTLAGTPPGGPIVVHLRSWEAQDFDGAAIAVGTFETGDEAERFAGAARAAGVPVNVIDKPAFCDFSFGSIVNRSPLVIGISTDGGAPVFARADAARRWRSAVKSSGLSFAGRRKFWQHFTAHALGRPNQEPAQSDFDALLAATKHEGATIEHGSVTLVGAGPGDPELLTLRAVRALQSADVILIDDLVAPGILDFARREAKKMLVGKTGFAPSCKQEEINALMVSLAKSGKRVVRLKGGDPLIFGRAGEEVAACRAAGILVEVVPGISAAQGAASRLALSLTHRKLARRVQYITGHGANGGVPDIDWQSLADPATTTVVYMPRKILSELSATAIARGLPADTVAIAVIAATRPEQTVITGTVADIAERLDAAAPDGPVLVMIGRALAADEDDADVQPTATVADSALRQQKAS